MKYLAVVVIFIFTGCAVGPDYERPIIEMPAEWIGKTPQVDGQQKEVWWKTWDEVLSKHIETALLHNKDLLIAVARIKEAEALSDRALADIFPQIAANAGYIRRSSSQTVIPRFPDNVISEDYSARSTLSWELDLWGRIRREDEAAVARLLASEANKNGVIIGLISSVAQNYVELRSLDKQLEIAKQTAESRHKAFSMTDSKYKVGMLSELELKQSESEYLTAKVLVPSYEKLVAAKEHQLNILLGNNPGPIERGKSIEELSKGFLIPMGLPSTLLTNRPDVLQAEQELIAANADIGAAIGAMFPTISITGMFGFQSSELKDLFKTPSRIWSLAPGMDFSIFTGGKASSEIDAREARKEQALLTYEKIVQNALKEVEDALVSYEKSSDEKTLRIQQISSLRRSLELSSISYQAGQTNLLTVLDTQRLLLNAEIEQTKVFYNYLSAVIELYRALGTV